MRVLLDECLPRGLKSELAGHEVRTVQEEGWAGLKNGALLQVAANRFDVLLMVDRNLAYQQNLVGLRIAVIAMVVVSNRLADILPLMGKVRQALSKARPGECCEWVANYGSQPTVGAPSWRASRSIRALRAAAADAERSQTRWSPAESSD